MNPMGCSVSIGHAMGEIVYIRCVLMYYNKGRAVEAAVDMQPHWCFRERMNKRKSIVSTAERVELSSKEVHLAFFFKKSCGTRKVFIRISWSSEPFEDSAPYTEVGHVDTHTFFVKSKPAKQTISPPSSPIHVELQQPHRNLKRAAESPRMSYIRDEQDEEPHSLKSRRVESSTSSE